MKKKLGKTKCEKFSKLPFRAKLCSTLVVSVMIQFLENFEKNIDFFTSEKTRENVAVFHYLAVDHFDFPRKIFQFSKLKKTMAKHHPDLIFCRKQAGVAIGRLCEKCDGRCVICDSYVRPCTLVRICDECNYGSYQGRCVICGGPGVSDAYYCKECTIQEKDRDGCPKVSIS